MLKKMLQKVLLSLSVLFGFFLLTVLSAFLQNKANPYLLHMDQLSQEMETEALITGTGYEEIFEVKRGTIRDVLSFEKTIPAGSYCLETLILNSKGGTLMAGPGDLICPGQALWQYQDGSFLSLSSNIRILSAISNPGTGKTHIRYLQSPDILLKLDIPERYLNKVNSDTDIHARIGAQEVRAAVSRIGEAVENHQFSVMIALEDPDLLGRTGSSVTIWLTMEEREDVLLVPKECVYTYHTGEAFVIIKRGEETFECIVETGISDERMTEIRSGLQEGDQVIAV